MPKTGADEMVIMAWSRSPCMCLHELLHSSNVWCLIEVGGGVDCDSSMLGSWSVDEGFNSSFCRGDNINIGAGGGRSGATRETEIYRERR